MEDWNNARLTARLDESFGQGRAGKAGKLIVFNTYPVQNVEVIAKKAKTSVMTDSLGQFSLVCFEKDIIKIKAKSFQPVNKKLEPDIDTDTLIMSKFSGVTVSGGNVYIRGSGSFSGQIQALIIVNGVSAGAIDWIQPCQIKTIKVLKDNEAAICGTRGGNGVVVIETRNDL